MKSSKVIIPVVIISVLAIVLGVFWIQQKSKEKDVLVSQEVIKEADLPLKELKVTEGLVSEEITELGRNFQLRLVAEVSADPKVVYNTLVDFDQLQGLIPDCTKLKVVETEGNKTVIYMRRFILFMGKELGGDLEYMLHPEELKFEVRVIKDPHANLHEKWSIAAAGDKTRVTYIADVKPKLKVPIFMAQAWIKDNFVDLMKAVKEKLENKPASG